MLALSLQVSQVKLGFLHASLATLTHYLTNSILYLPLKVIIIETIIVFSPILAVYADGESISNSYVENFLRLNMAL